MLRATDFHSVREDFFSDVVRMALDCPCREIIAAPHAFKQQQSITAATFRTTNVAFLVGLRKFFCFKVAFIAPREESRARGWPRLWMQLSTLNRLTSRGAMKATLVAAEVRAGFNAARLSSHNRAAERSFIRAT